METITEVVQKHSRKLLSIKGVVGVAEGESGGKPCIKVYVSRKTQELMDRIPASLEGYNVCIVESGDFHAFAQT